MTYAIIQLDPMNNLQKKPDLLPFNWIKLDDFEEKILKLRDSQDPYFQELDQPLYDQTYYFINSAIKSVLEEQ